MDREEWEREYKRLYDAPLAPILRFRGFSDEELESISARTRGELSEMDESELREFADKLGILKYRSLGSIARTMKYLPRVAELAFSGKWEEFCSMVELWAYDTIPLAFTYFYPDMPDEYRRDFVIDLYQHHGDSIEEVREALSELPNNGRDDLPVEYRDLEELTVYRAGEEPIDEAEEYLSWTLDEKVARFFKDRLPSESRHLYRAHIRPDDIIAYTDDREEREVIQYLRVYDVEEIEAPE